MYTKKEWPPSSLVCRFDARLTTPMQKGLGWRDKDQDRTPVRRTA